MRIYVHVVGYTVVSQMFARECCYEAYDECLRWDAKRQIAKTFVYIIHKCQQYIHRTA